MLLANVSVAGGICRRRRRRRRRRRTGKALMLLSLSALSDFHIVLPICLFTVAFF